ncbi:hypothetical protein [Shimia sp. R9_2]|uniref:hypothetical protein n=1 Tax=Shimia sp. R9_2 TaxID=2821112 RepID=UPI001FFDF33B|nr:hypothetical protein [Shimia sp. R9_2]
MASAMQAMVTCLQAMREDNRPGLMTFSELRERIGFEDYYEASARYASSARET